MSGSDRRRLENERALLEASLADARKEFDAGELDEASFEEITARDRARLVELDDELKALPEEVVIAETTAPHRERTPRSRRPVIGAMALVIVGLTIALIVVLTSGTTPSTTSQINSKLAQADTLVAQGKIAEALPLYGQVLAIDPNQPEALAQSGWLTYETGSRANSQALMVKGEAQIKQALTVAPSFAAAHLYLGIIYLVSASDPSGAMSEFRSFLNLKPPASLVTQAMPYIEKAAAQAGVPVPTTTP